MCHRSATCRASGAPGPHTFGVGAGTVTADDLDSGMSTQPARESVGGAVGEHVDRTPGFDIDQDRAVVVPATQREVVDTEDARCARVRIGKCPDQPQQRHPADRGRQMTGHPGARAATQGQRDRAQKTLQNVRAPGIPPRQPGRLLGESRPAARGVVAEQPPYSQPDHHLPGGDRGVGQSPPVAAVDPPR